MKREAMSLQQRESESLDLLLDGKDRNEVLKGPIQAIKRQKLMKQPLTDKISTEIKKPFPVNAAQPTSNKKQKSIILKLEPLDIFS